MFHAESREKGQDQFRQGVRLHLRVLDLNVPGDELLYFAAVSSNDGNRFRWQYCPSHWIPLDTPDELNQLLIEWLG